MTDKQMEKLAYEISNSVNDCRWCVIKEECKDSGYGECGGVWYEHIQKMISKDEEQQHIKYWMDKLENQRSLEKYNE